MVKKSIPGAVLGIIGAVFAIIGGFSLALCADLVAGATGGAVNFVWAAYVFGLGGGVLGLVGAIMDFKNPKIGGILQILAVVFVIVVCILMYFQWAMIVALILFVIGAILSFCIQKKVE